MVRFLALAIALGVLTGLGLGPASALAETVGKGGMFVIQALKTLATPLLFFAIVDTFCKTRVDFRDGAKLVSISAINACVALGISLILVSWAPFGTALHGSGSEALGHSIAGGHNIVIPVVLGALLIGILLRTLSLESGAAGKIISRGFRLFYTLLTWITYLVPVAVFCVLTQIVAKHGLSIFATLASFALLVVSGMLVQVGVYYSALLKLAGYDVRRFFKDCSAPLLTSFSIGSSLAALPVTLDTLEKKRGIPPKYARLAAAVGTNLNHDGIILYEAIAALFVARIYGVQLSLTQQIGIATSSVMAAIGIAGVPDAGLITLSLVLGAAGLPLEAATLLLPIDWFIGRLRATTNVASDMTVAHLLYRLQKATAVSEALPVAESK